MQLLPAQHSRVTQHEEYRIKLDAVLVWVQMVRKSLGVTIR
jgi:hypothetical protein